MKKNKTALLLVLASSALILAGCGKQATSSSAAKSSTAASSTAAVSSTATSSTAKSSTPASSTPASSTPASSTPTSSTPTSSTPTSSTPTSSSTVPVSSSSEPEPAKVDIAYADDDFTFGGAGDAGLGHFVFWNGEGGTISAHSKSNGVYSLSYKAAGAWYGIQAFYKLPYAESGDTYKVEWKVNSDVAGDITINSVAYTLVAGDNTLEFGVTQGAGTTLGLQLGTVAGSLLAGAEFKFYTPVIYDLTAGAQYNEVKFMNGTSAVKDIQVKNGKFVSAPADPTPETGYIFDGWYNGTAAFDATVAVTEAATYEAKFVSESEATQYTVSFLNGTESLGTTKIIKGKKVVVPSLTLPFGYTVVGWYKEAALTNAWNLASDVVTADVSLYAKLNVTPSATFMNTDATGWVIPSANLSNNADGSFKASGFAGWGSGSWAVQVNFGPVPATDSTKTYTIGFKYKINAAGGDAQVYDGATIGNVVTLAEATEWTSAAITFTGHACGTGSKLTFELGAIATTVTSITFELSEITLTVA